MVIVVVDDSIEVRDAFSYLIQNMGHEIRTFQSLDAFERGFVGIEHSYADIVYLDNHFPGEATGIGKLPSYIKKKPGIDFVVMTKLAVDAPLVDVLVTNKVGFFYNKPLYDSDLFTAEIQARIAERDRKFTQIRKSLNWLLEYGQHKSEGLFSIFNFMKNENCDYEVLEVTDMNESLIVPDFKPVGTVRHTDEDTIKEVIQEVHETEFLMKSEMGVGLDIDSSKGLLAKSLLGTKIKTHMKTSIEGRIKKVLTGTWEAGKKIKIPECDLADGVRRIAYYQGLSYRKHKVVVEIKAPKLIEPYIIDLYLFMPDKFVEVTTSFNAEGAIIKGRDERKSYTTMKQIDHKQISELIT